MFLPHLLTFLTYKGNIFEQVHCGMVYLDYMEILVPAFVGELLSCIAEVSFTSSYHLEMRCAVWAEDLAQSMSACQ